MGQQPKTRTDVENLRFQNANWDSFSYVRFGLGYLDLN